MSPTSCQTAPPRTGEPPIIPGGDTKARHQKRLEIYLGLTLLLGGIANTAAKAPARSTSENIAAARHDPHSMISVNAHTKPMDPMALSAQNMLDAAPACELPAAPSNKVRDTGVLPSQKTPKTTAMNVPLDGLDACSSG